MEIVRANPNWWQQHSRFVKIVLLLCISALLLKDSTEAVHVSELSILEGNHQGDQVDECTSAECYETASNILSEMDQSIDPCDDFHQFSCGNFLLTETIPDDKSAITAFSMIADKLREQLKVLIEEPPVSSAKYLQLPHEMYMACMNTELIEELGTSPITDISESLGGWPVIRGESWNADNSWTMVDTVSKFRKLGLSMDYIVDFSLSVDLKNSTKRVLDIDQPSTAVSREYLINGFDDPIVNAYYSYMIDMAVLFGAENDIATQELGQSLQFEIDLATISWSNERRRNTTALYNLRPVAELQARYPYIGWKDYINSLLPEGLRIDDDELINISVPSFFEDLGTLLAQTPDRVVANYLMWRIHSFSVPFLPDVFRKRQLQYSTVLSGAQEQEARWKECVDVSSGSGTGIYYPEQANDYGLAIIAGSLYVRKHFKEDDKSIALEMVDDIKSIYGDILEHVEWMDEETRKSALEKLGTMTSYIGYPDEIIDNNKLEEYFEALDIDPDKYFQSFLKLTAFGMDKSFNDLRLPVNKSDWIPHAKAAVVNAYYSPIENSIQFPAGILQGKFFNSKRPKYLNYGGIGFVIGHEMTHGFDDQGRQFDWNGNLIDWWQEETEAAFLIKAQCFIEQYGNYTESLTGLSLNGINTQGENIADNGGIKEAYIAYRRWAYKYGTEPKLPGLDYTPEQMFWISSAQIWCEKQRKESLKMVITTDIHSPSEFRILGPPRNMRDFATDFQCPEGSPMNPVDKCEVW